MKLTTMYLRRLLVMSLTLLATTACVEGSDEELDLTETTTEEESERTIEMARGADVSWLTQMESEGYNWYYTNGTQGDCLEILSSLGVNAIRLRVWVDPEDGWCGQDDVVAKAVRASELGMRIMIDFHYSDSWADPSQQYKPAAWEGLTLSELRTAIEEHTQSVLTALKDAGVDVEWVQIGNEIGAGMLWDTDYSVSGASYNVTDGDLTYPANYENLVAFINYGYWAAKGVYNDCKVVLQLQDGHDADLYTWFFDILAEYDCNYDVIGMSLYPETTNWKTYVSNCMTTVDTVLDTYEKEVMICEVGMSWDAALSCNQFLTLMLAQLEQRTDCLGIFYWEPECYNSWQGYTKGAFNDDGTPTVALEAYLD